MFPELLLRVLLVAPLVSDSSSDQPEDNTGDKFVIAFPENIAYYHPIPPTIKVYILSLYGNNQVRIECTGQSPINDNLNAGQLKYFTINSDVELRKLEISDGICTITSDKEIVVSTATQKINSVQTALVLPAEKLGTVYNIPPIPDIPGTTDDITLAVTEQRPFKLVIISSGESATVSIEGATATNVSLQPDEVAQVLVRQQDQVRSVSSDKRVAVLLSHSCAIQYNCTCGMLQSALSPAKHQMEKYPIPPQLTSGSDGQTRLLLSGAASTSSQVYDINDPPLEVNGNAVLYRPGLLISLIPETDFASCFVIRRVWTLESSFIILVPKDQKDEVQHGNDTLQNPDWQPLSGSNYVSAKVTMTKNKNVVWHPSANIAVYFMGVTHSSTPKALFGNPAAIVSRIPDFRGCVLVPEKLLIGDIAYSWSESAQFCRDEGLELVSLSSPEEVQHIYSLIENAKNGSNDDVWIGMRRRSQTGEWYSVNQEPICTTNWASGEPGDPENDGQCAIMSLSSFKWRDEECCQAARPVCYKRPLLLPL